MKGTQDTAPSSAAILTVPNLLSLIRIAAIPVFCYLIVHGPTTQTGLVVFGAVIATDWVDGYAARRLHQVSELGRVLDPVADRLAIAAGLISLVVRGAIPLWAALLILVRDAAVLIAGAAILARRRVRLDVRFIGKAATFSLMVAIPAIAWGTLGYALAPGALAVGWVSFAVGIVEYYVAAAIYAGDLRRALSAAP